MRGGSQSAPAPRFSGSFPFRQQRAIHCFPACLPARRIFFPNSGLFHNHGDPWHIYPANDAILPYGTDCAYFVYHSHGTYYHSHGTYYHSHGTYYHSYGTYYHSYGTDYHSYCADNTTYGSYHSTHGTHSPYGTG